MSHQKSTAQGVKQQDKLLLELREKIYMRAVSGVFARWRWGMVWFTQILFYGLPWLHWNNRQAVLFDLAARKFHIFGLILYPQDFIYITALLLISALALFLFTTIAGRLWCGYACPQTVYTEIFMWVERVVEGDRGKRMKHDRAPWSLKKFRLKATKHVLWIVIAIWTGFTFVGYFTPIRELAFKLATLSIAPWQLFWILFYGLATYGNAGFLREQVCKYMCPYARFQGVMFDRDTMVITYDPGRGNPRGQRGRKDNKAALGLGDCIDCGLCVQVCPTGIDIRDGQQYECIGCAACIDACDKVMSKIGYEPGLIRYDTLNSMEGQGARSSSWKKVFRPRVLVYLSILTTLVVLFFVSIGSRIPLKVDVMRDRGSLSREVKNGLIENVYRLMIINAVEQPRQFNLSVEGLGATIDTVQQISVDPASNRLTPVRVRVDPAAGRAGGNKITFVVQAVDDPKVIRREHASFFLPHQRGGRKRH